MDTEDVDLAGAAERKARKAATLWNVRGVDEAHRAMAKEAAEKCDMTLGRWLTEVIEKVAAMPIWDGVEQAKISERPADSGMDGQQPVKGRAPASTRS